jgi:hypothetical protein
MHYIIYIIIGIGLGLSATSILKSNSKKVQNAKDNLEAKKEWIRMLSNQKKQNNSNRLMRR